MIGGPLRHSHDRRLAVGGGRDVVEQVAVAEAAAVGDALRVELVEGGGDLGDFFGREQPADDRIAVAAVVGSGGVRARRCEIALCKAHDCSAHLFAREIKGDGAGPVMRSLRSGMPAGTGLI